MDSHDPRRKFAAVSQDADPERVDECAGPVASARWLEANLPLSLDAYEKAALERALVASWGDAAEAARMLEIGRSTFYRKAGKHGIHLGGPRPAASTRAPEPAAPASSRSDGAGVGPTKPLG